MRTDRVPDEVTGFPRSSQHAQAGCSASRVLAAVKKNDFYELATSCQSRRNVAVKNHIIVAIGVYRLSLAVIAALVENIIIT